MSTLYSEVKEVYELLWGRGYLKTLPVIFVFYCAWHWRAFQEHGFVFGLRSNLYVFAGYLLSMTCVLVIGVIS